MNITVNAYSNTIHNFHKHKFKKLNVLSSITVRLCKNYIMMVLFIYTCISLGYSTHFTMSYIFLRTLSQQCHAHFKSFSVRNEHSRIEHSRVIYKILALTVVLHLFEDQSTF